MKLAAIIAVAVVAAPMAIGASGAFIRLALESVLVAAIAMRAALHPGKPGVVLGIAALAAALGAQLVPLPCALASYGAPLCGSAWEAASAGAPPTLLSLSVNPAATAAGARRLILGVAVIALVADLAKSAGVFRLLSTALAISGIAVLTAGVVLPRRSPDRLVLGIVDLKGPIKWWLTPLEPAVRTCGVGEMTRVTVGGVTYLADEGNVGDICGPYIYSNHFAGGLCLMLPFAFAVWLVLTLKYVPNGLRHLVVLSCAAGVTWFLWHGVGSRGGTAAFVMAAIVFCASVASARWSRWLCGVAAGGYCVAFSVFVMAVLGQMRGIEALLPAGWRQGFAKALADPRVRETSVAMDMFRGSPWLGTGLNTYDDMNGYLTKGRFVSYYAHNEYAALLGETGLVGAAVALAMAVLFGRRFVRFWRFASGDSRLLGAGAWAALAGIAAHSWFEWNLHLPANGFLAAVAAGLAWASATPDGERKSEASGPWAQRFRLIVPLGCVILGVFFFRDAFSEATQRELRAALTADRIAMNDPSKPPTAPVLATAITRGERMALWDRQNAHLAVLLGQAHLHLTAREHGAIAGHVPPAAERWFSQSRQLAPAVRGGPKP